MLGKVIRLALIAGVLGLIGMALFRPAALFGVDSKALANSVGHQVQHAHADCKSGSSGLWRCKLSGGNLDGVEYVVTTHRFGCWTATRLGRTRASEMAYRSVSGCIGLTDLFGH